MAPHRVRRTAQSLKRDIGLAATTATPIHNVDGPRPATDVTQDHAQTRALRTIVFIGLLRHRFLLCHNEGAQCFFRPPARETRVAGLLCHWKRLHFAIGWKTARLLL